MVSNKENLSSPSKQVFHSSFWRAYVPVVFLLLLMAVVLVFTAKPSNLSIQWFCFALVVASAVAAIPLSFSTCAYRTDVDAFGIGGHNLWNVYGRVTWDDISE